MARKARPAAAARSSAGSTKPEPGPKPERERIIESFMDLLGRKPIEEIGFAEIAAGAGTSLTQLRGLFGSKLAILAGHIKQIDQRVLAGGDGEMVEEAPRERLFDVLMRRIELLEPRKAAVRSLMRSCGRQPGLALALNGLAVRSQHWMLTAADLDAGGPWGAARAQGLALLFASVLRTWVHDDDPGHARTMAALDRALARGQRLSGFLDNLSRIPNCIGRMGRRRHRDEGEFDEEGVTV